MLPLTASILAAALPLPFPPAEAREAALPFRRDLDDALREAAASGRPVVMVPGEGVASDSASTSALAAVLISPDQSAGGAV